MTILHFTKKVFLILSSPTSRQIKAIRLIC